LFSTCDKAKMYYQMVLIRKAEQTIVEEYERDEMKCPMHMSMGQEASTVGALFPLGERAITFSSYRSHAAYLTSTDDVEGFFAELYGKDTGPNQGYAGSMHIADGRHWLSSGIVAAQIPIAVGAAFGFKYQEDDRVAVVFLGDGATNEGGFWESLNIATLYRLPVLFVVEDNLLAVNTPPMERTAYRVTKELEDVYRYLTYGQAKGYDVLDVADVADSVVRNMDMYGMPGLLKVECCRYLEHVGIHDDSNAGYRWPGRLELWKRSDPIELLMEDLSQDEARDAEFAAHVAVDNAVRRAKAAEFAVIDDITMGVYARG